MYCSLTPTVVEQACIPRSFVGHKFWQEYRIYITLPFPLLNTTTLLPIHTSKPCTNARCNIPTTVYTSSRYYHHVILPQVQILVPLVNTPGSAVPCVMPSMTLVHFEVYVRGYDTWCKSKPSLGTHKYGDCYNYSSDPRIVPVARYSARDTAWHRRDPPVWQ